jgi:murein DD-endopeptidase MepM/ murein hydrolase activator NlpD
LAQSFSRNRRSAEIAIAFAIFLSTVLAGRSGAATSLSSQAPKPQVMTPMLLAVKNSPVPFTGSDGRTHLVYELWLTNFSSAKAAVEQVQISGDGKILETLKPADIATRLQPAGTRVSSATMAASARALLFIHITMPAGAAIPSRLSHRVRANFDAAPPGHREITASLDGTPVDNRKVAVFAPPLKGARYISADSCCDSTRHMRAALPVDGKVWISQRFAVDWEQLDGRNRIYTGAKTKLESYTIYGKPALAVADARVVTAINDQPDQTPGSFPTGLTLDQADGNAVILDLGGGNFAMYAHLHRGSVRVAAGDRVTRGQVIGLVGNSGNSIAPHLHFQVMDGPESITSNGLPYAIDRYRVTASTPGTAAFDSAEANGTPLALARVASPKRVTAALPLDQQIISFGN